MILLIDPYDKNKLNPNSYNLSLHNELLVYDDLPLDMKKENRCKKLSIPQDGVVVEARPFIPWKNH